MQYKIAFDIDGIILDTATEIWKAITTVFEIPLDIDKWNNYDISEVLGIPIDELRPIYEPVLYKSDMPLVEGAGAALEKIAQKYNNSLLLITARRPQFIKPAIESIQRELPNIELNVHSPMKSCTRAYSGQGDDKTNLLKQFEVEYFVDDHPVFWELYMESGVNIFTFDLPWTKEKISLISKLYKDRFSVTDWDYLGRTFS